MLNDEPGKIFRERRASRPHQRSEKVDGSACVLILDPILGSRFSLAQAVAYPGIHVQTSSTAEEARSVLSQREVALIIVEHQLSEGDGIDFLVEVRERHPATQRALVTSVEGPAFIRGAIDRAGLCFLLSKPWNPASLRKTVREVLGGRSDYTGWNNAGWNNARFEESLPASPNPPKAEGSSSDRDHEILLRGLLAGLNSCEFEAEVFELLHTELAEPFGVAEWFWVDEERGLGTRIAGDWPVECGVPLETLPSEMVRLLAKARQSLRVTRLDEELSGSPSNSSPRMCLGLAIRDGGRRSKTGLIIADRQRIASLVSMLRELQTGLQMVFRRIRLADARAEAARRLALHVSEELRTPVGALTHAIDRLRGEAERAGMPSEWVDRVSSESERLARAVEHLEGEMRTDAMGLSGSSS